jgi:hypothetical protein
MRVEDQQPFLGALDSTLLPMGFTRRKRSQEWSKRSGSDRLWVHLNFGLGVVNPSFGVEYEDLKRRWPELPGAIYGTMKVLTSLLRPRRCYAMEGGPRPIVVDLQQVGLPNLAQLQDRGRVVEMLKSPDPTDWPVPSFSFRIRLLPLLLLALDRQQEALDVGSEFAADAAARDQIVPPYERYLAAIRSAVAG